MKINFICYLFILTFNRSISFADNNLTGNIPTSFQQLNLSWLDISNNRLTGGLSNLESSKQLTYLDMRLVFYI